MDGGRVPYQHPPRKEMTFFNYAELIFKVLTTFFQFYNRIDLVFDIYKADSLKATTREKRGRGTRRHVTKEGKCPSNWPMFLKEDRNKEELNIFLAEQLSVMTFPPGKTLFVTSLEKVKSNSSDTMPDSDHEEADTRMCLHVKDAISKGMTDIKVMSSDTDVVLIFLSIFHLLAAMQSSLNDIVMEFGSNKSHRVISIKNLATALGQKRCRSLLFLHSISGSDTTSSFRNIDKKKAYDVLNFFPEAETVFESFFLEPFQDITDNMQKFSIIERFTVLMYAKTSITHSVNQLREEIFNRNANVEAIPPTQDALLQYTKRAIYQAGVWARSLQTHQDLPSPRSFGWKHNNAVERKWVPFWMTQQPVSKELRKYFVVCHCTTPCGSNSKCSCKKANMPCTSICTCNCTGSDKFIYTEPPGQHNN